MRLTTFGTCLLFALFALQAGCSQGNQGGGNTVSSTEMDGLKGAIEALQTKQGAVDSLQSDIAALKGSVQYETDKQQRLMMAVDNTLAKLSADVAALKDAERDRYKAVVDLKSKVYIPVATPAGTFLLVVDGVEASRDGTTVNLLVGNPMAAAVKGFKLKAEWGGKAPTVSNASPEAAAQAYEQWEKSLVKKEFDFNDRLESGKWNRITCELGKFAPRDLAYLGLALEPQEIALQR